MPTMPYQSEEDIKPELKIQIYKLVQNLYSDDKVGATDVGDVFSISNDVFTLNLSDTSGLQKTNNLLSVVPKSDGGLEVSGDDGLGVKIANSTLVSDGDGIRCKESSGFPCGIATILAGDAGVEVLDPYVTLSDRIMLNYMESPVGADNILWVSTIEENYSFTIRCFASHGIDVDIAWAIVNP